MSKNNTIIFAKISIKGHSTNFQLKIIPITMNKIYTCEMREQNRENYWLIIKPSDKIIHHEAFFDRISFRTLYFESHVLTELTIQQFPIILNFISSLNHRESLLNNLD